MSRDTFPINGSSKEIENWMFQDSIMKGRVKQELERIEVQTAIRTTALQCASRLATNQPLPSAANVLDSAKMFEKYLKGE